MLKLNMVFRPDVAKSMSKREFYVNSQNDIERLLSDYFRVRVDSTSEIGSWEEVESLPEGSRSLGNGLWIYDKPDPKDLAFMKADWYKIVNTLDDFAKKLYDSLPTTREYVETGLYTKDPDSNDDSGSYIVVLDFDNFSDVDKRNYQLYLKFKSKAGDLSYQFVEVE